MAFIQRKSRPISRGAAVIFGILMAIGGLCIVVFAGIPQGLSVWEVRSWKEVPCELKRAEIEVTTDGETNVRSVIEYTFTWKGETVTKLEEEKPLDVNAREEQLAVLRAQPPKTCLVNPDNFQQSKLERPAWTAPLIFTVAGGVVMLAGILVAWRPKVSDRTGTKLLLWMVPACLLIFAGSGSLCIWLAVRDDWKSVEPRLKEVPCTIVTSGVKSSRRNSARSGDGKTYSPDILFRYEWEGHAWHSNWVDFSRNNVRSSDRGSSQETAGRFPEGSRQKCWVDPERPWVAVLEKNYGPVWVLWLCGIVFGSIGLLGLALWFSRGILIKRFKKTAPAA